MKIIATSDAPAAIGPYVQGKIVNGLLYASGQIPLNPLNGEIVGDSIETLNRTGDEKYFCYFEGSTF